MKKAFFCPVLVCLFVFVKSRVSFQMWQAPGCDVPDSMKLSKYTLNSMQNEFQCECVYIGNSIVKVYAYANSRVSRKCFETCGDDVT